MSKQQDLLNLLNSLKSWSLSTASRRGEHPTDRKSRQQLITEASRGGASSSWGIMRYNAVPEQYYPCTVPFEQLAKVLLCDLALETHHQGRYLIVRTIAKPTRLDGVIIVVEDEEGDAALLDVYNQLGPRLPKTAEAINMPPMGLYVVKEPFYHVSRRGDYVIRVDHPSDLVWLPDNDVRVPSVWRDASKTAKDWRQEGTTAFQAGHYRDAIAKYTTALACAGVDDDERCAIRLNRAMAYLKCECYEHALADASITPADGKQSEKGLYRAGSALYKLGRFAECECRLEELLAEYPDNQPGQELLARVKRRLHEQQSGDFEFDTMYDQVNRGQREVDVATYIGPVAVREAGSRGRGLFTTEAVKAGQLLLCEKPFVYCPPAIESTPPAAHVNVIAIPSEFKGFLGAEGDIVPLAIQKSFRNPSAAADMATLYCGSYKPKTVNGLVDGQPVVDFYHMSYVGRLTAFSSPLSEYHSYYVRTPAQKAAHDAEADIETLERFRHRAAGIWCFAAFLNHDCGGTVHRAFIGDALILRAGADLPAGAELTMSYVARSDPRAAEKLRQFWGIDACGCAICIDARATLPRDVQRRRDDALHAARNALGGESMLRLLAKTNGGAMGGGPEDVFIAQAMRRLGMSSDLAAVEARVLAAARAFAPVSGAATAAAAAASGSVPRPELAEILHKLSVAYERAAGEVPTGAGATAAHAAQRRANYDKAISHTLAALRQLGFVIRESGRRWDDGAVVPAPDNELGNRGDTAADNPSAAKSTGEPVRQRLVVEKWGACTDTVQLHWFRLARRLRHGGAAAALVEDAKALARTCYCILIGEDVTFEREYAKATTVEAGEEEAKNTVNMLMF